jgi:hypothetical protein
VQVAQVRGAVVNIGQAVEALKLGRRVARAGWNGKGMWLVYVPAGFWTIGASVKMNANLDGLPFVAMKTADDKLVPWLCSQTDLLADDWRIVE